MGLPFVIVEGTLLIIDKDGNVVQAIPNVADKIRVCADSTIRGANLTGDGYLAADVIKKNNQNALVTSAFVTVEQIFGQDGFSDTWFWVDDAGANGDSLRIQIAGYTDPTAPNERNVPAIDVTVNVTASEAGQEYILAQKIVSELNADTDFKAHWKASIGVQKNPMVHIASRIIGEIGDRTGLGAFLLTPTGTVDTRLESTDNEEILRRGKANSGTKDPRDKRLVTTGVSGEVSSVPGAVGALFLEPATHPTYGRDLTQNGSLGTPIEFIIMPDAEKDIFIKDMRFHGGGSGIKFSNFLDMNTALTNGILVEVKSDDQTIQFPLIRTTNDLKSRFTYGAGLGWVYDVSPSFDHVVANFNFESPFPLRKQGSFTVDDYIKVFIRDNVKNSELFFDSFGFLQEV